MSFTDSNHQEYVQLPSAPCRTEDIYVSGLMEGEKLISEQPFLILDTNGIVVGLNEQFKQFYHLDAAGKILDILPIQWSSCEKQRSDGLKTMIDVPLHSPWSSLFLLSALVVSIGGYYVIRKI